MIHKCDALALGGGRFCGAVLDIYQSRGTRSDVQVAICSGEADPHERVELQQVRERDVQGIEGSGL
jgi:hypothetical protein